MNGFCSELYIENLGLFLALQPSVPLVPRTLLVLVGMCPCCPVEWGVGGTHQAGKWSPPLLGFVRILPVGLKE